MLHLSNLKKEYALQEGGRFVALDDVSLTIPQGSFFTLLGPSGCGKTTTLRSIAGLEQPDSGQISINGESVFDSRSGMWVPPHRRRIGMVFQSYAIWPHMDVFENVAFPLRVQSRRLTEDEVRKRVRHALESVRMAEYERRPATRLSGGQQQRVAMARALVRQPQVLLLDEPLSNLDALLRETMRLELRRIQRQLGITTVYVTHDQAEALAISDVVAVMRNGRVVQQGDVHAVYNVPESLFVAEFIGAANLLPGRVRGATPGTGIVGVDLAFGHVLAHARRSFAVGESVMISVRPENISVEHLGRSAPRDGHPNLFEGHVSERSFLGHTVELLIAVGDAEVRVWTAPAGSPHVGDSVRLHLNEDHCAVLATKEGFELGRSTKRREGDRSTDTQPVL